MAKTLKNCGTCFHWENTIERPRTGECLETGKLLESTETCSKHQYDPAQACTLCGGTVTEDDECSALYCTEDNSHVASMWSYEWVGFDPPAV